VIVEPLERGFGITIGNALRRVLLSSLQGAAITSVQIDGVLHEFAAIPGVREDVTDIVLNLKTIGIRGHGETPKRCYLKVEGPAVVTAGMIETPHDVEIMDPDHVICHVDQGGRLSVELTVQTGKGYVAAHLNKAEDAPIGLIAIDAIYSPVRKVAYKVDNSRVGQQTDYDRLTLQLETDGSVSPEDALALPASCRTSCSCSSTSRSRRPTGRARSSATCRSTRTCCARSTSSSCRSARRTA
jgi:DNA-directed RNA polymerase subunit alpha